MSQAIEVKTKITEPSTFKPKLFHLHAAVIKVEQLQNV